jgi:uncharacterized protein (UPF0212 family)
MPKDPPAGDEDVIEVRCPDCGATVRVARVVAERDMVAKCPKGHEVQLVKAL